MNEEYIKYENKDKKPQYKCVDPLYFLQKRPVLRLDPPKKLNYEMLEAYNVLKPKPEEFSIRAYLVTKMKKLIKSFDKELIVEIFGSYECDLFLHTSDIDIVIYKSHGEVQNSVLNELRKVLDRCDFIDSKSVFHIKRAKIPIIRCNDSVFNMRFDISTEIRGVEQSTFIKSEIAKKPFLKNFALLLKYFIKVRDLADSKRGGCAPTPNFYSSSTFSSFILWSKPNRLILKRTLEYFLWISFSTLALITQRRPRLALLTEGIFKRPTLILFTR